MSPELKEFYKYMQHSIDNKGKTVIQLNSGLCNLLYDYMRVFKDLSATRERQRDNVIRGVISEQSELFKAAGLDEDYPFNTSFEDYRFEALEDTHYKNPKRLAWIKEHAQDGPISD